MRFPMVFSEDLAVRTQQNLVQPGPQASPRGMGLKDKTKLPTSQVPLIFMLGIYDLPRALLVQHAVSDGPDNTPTQHCSLRHITTTASASHKNGSDRGSA